MNLYELNEFLRQSARDSGAVQAVKRQCVAVCTVVYVQCARQRAAVHLVVYGNAGGRVRLSGSVSEIYICYSE
jgi:hypothetical protein